MKMKCNEKRKRIFKKKSAPEELQLMIKNDINDLHDCLSFDIFRYKLDHIKIKWANYSTLRSFSDYFIKQWCFHNGEWSRWCRLPTSQKSH